MAHEGGEVTGVFDLFLREKKRKEILWLKGRGSNPLGRMQSLKAWVFNGFVNDDIRLQNLGLCSRSVEMIIEQSILETLIFDITRQVSSQALVCCPLYSADLPIFSQGAKAFLTLRNGALSSGKCRHKTSFIVLFWTQSIPSWV